jgi:hypothetical protein
MEKNLFLTLFLFIIFVNISEAQWVSNGSTQSISLGTSIARDVSGNVYGAGIFTCDLTIQNDTLHNPSCGTPTTLPLPTSRFDGYILKYNAAGKLLWSKQIIGNENNPLFEVKGISTSNSFLVVTGHYKGSLTFEGTTITNSTSVSDVFVAAFDLNGSFLWVKTNFTRNATSEVAVSSISATAAGSVVFTGKYKGSVVSSNDVDTITSTSYALYLMKLTASGNYVWIKSSKGKNPQSKAEGKDLWQDTNGNIFLTGNITDTVTVQQSTIKFPFGISGIFISKFSQNGVLRWIQKESLAHVNSIELEKDQTHFLLGGDFENKNVISGDTLNTTATYGAYVARYDTAGVMQWVKRLTVSSVDSAASVLGVSGDIDGNAYVTGIFGKKSSSGAVLSSGNKNIMAKPGLSLYIAKYKQDGTLQWLQVNAEGKIDSGNDIIAYDSSQVFFTGYFNSIIRIDSSVASNSSLGLNSFVARIDDCPYFQATIKVPAASLTCKRDSILLQAITGTGLIYQWQKNGADIAGATSANFYAKDSAFYRIVVHSNNPALTCIKYSPGIFITINPLPDTTISILGKLEFCDTAGVTISARFGNTYKWQLSKASISTETKSNFTAKKSGAYRVVLTNNKGCVDTSRTLNIVSVPTPIALISPTGKFIICQGDSVIMTATSGFGNSYQWYKDDVVLTNDTLPSYKAITTGLYKVFVKNKLGCGTFSLADTVGVNSAPTAVITSSSSLNTCSYQLPTLSTTANTSINTIQWLKNGLVLPITNTNSYTPAESGLYAIKVTNAINCSRSSLPLNVTIYPQPIASVIQTGSGDFCANDSVRINASIGTYTYAWQRNETTIPNAQSSIYYGKKSGTYRVIISDVNQCKDTSSVIVLSSFSVPIATIQATGNLTFCTGDSVTLNATSGTGLSYEWFFNKVTMPLMINRTEVIKSSGDYTVRVYNSIGCADTSVVQNIHVYSIPPNTITYSSPLDFCDGGQVILSAVNDPAFQCQWRKNNVTIAAGGKNSNYTVSTSGTYMAIISINEKCTNVSAGIVVTVKPVLKPVITVDNEFISVASFLSYQWFKNSSAIPGAVNQIYKVTENGQYSIHVSDPGGCSVQADPVIVCIPVPHIQSNGNLLSSTSGSFYQWYVNNVAISDATSQSYLVNTTGDYKINILRGDGCASFSNSIHVCIPPPVITVGDNNVLNASPGLTYQWFLNGVLLVGIDTRIIVAAQSGDYTVQVGDLSGCISLSAPITIYVSPTSITNGFKNTAIRCYPNPFETSFTLDIESSLLPLTAYVYDINGILLLKTEINSITENIPLDHLSSGSYVLMLSSASHRTYYKLLKMPK